MESMNLYGDLEKAIAGQSFGLDAPVESLAAGEKLYPGDPVFGMVGDEKVGYGAHVSAVSLTASADLVTGNSITITINGIALEAVTFEGSSVDTIKKIVGAIDQSDEIRALGIDAFFEEGSPRAFILQGPGVTITAAAVVSGGASQASFTSAAYTAMRFMGVVRFEHVVYGNEAGCFPAGVSVPVQTGGKIYAPVADSANPDDKKVAYVILSGADAGKFTDQSGGGNYDCGCFFRSERVSGNLALIELRGMK
jgi:hypothetical protein